MLGTEPAVTETWISAGVAPVIGAICTRPSRPSTVAFQASSMFPALSAAIVPVTTAVAEVATSRPWATVAPISVGSEPERTLNPAVALVVTPATTVLVVTPATT